MVVPLTVFLQLQTENLARRLHNSVLLQSKMGHAEETDRKQTLCGLKDLSVSHFLQLLFTHSFLIWHFHFLLTLTPHLILSVIQRPFNSLQYKRTNYLHFNFLPSEQTPAGICWWRCSVCLCRLCLQRCRSDPVGHGWLAFPLCLAMDNLLWWLNLFSDLLSWYMPEQAECK